MKLKNEIEQGTDEYIRSLKEENKKLKEENIKLNKLIVVGAQEIIDETINKEFTRFKKLYLDEINILINVMSDREETINKIELIIEEKIEDLKRDFYENNLSKLNDELNYEFNNMIQDYFKSNFKKDIKEYSENVIKKTIKNYDDEDFKVFIKEIYSKIIEKYNIKISKRLLQESSNMSNIQIETITKCIENIKLKEKLFIEKFNNSKKEFSLIENMGGI